MCVKYCFKLVVKDWVDRYWYLAVSKHSAVLSLRFLVSSEQCKQPKNQPMYLLIRCCPTVDKWIWWSLCKRVLGHSGALGDTRATRRTCKYSGANNDFHFLDANDLYRPVYPGDFCGDFSGDFLLRFQIARVNYCGIASSLHGRFEIAAKIASVNGPYEWYMNTIKIRANSTAHSPSVVVDINGVAPKGKNILSPVELGFKIS